MTCGPSPLQRPVQCCGGRPPACLGDTSKDQNTLAPKRAYTHAHAWCRLGSTAGAATPIDVAERIISFIKAGWDHAWRGGGGLACWLLHDALSRGPLHLAHAPAAQSITLHACRPLQHVLPCVLGYVGTPPPPIGSPRLAFFLRVCMRAFLRAGGRGAQPGVRLVCVVV